MILIRQSPIIKKRTANLAKVIITGGCGDVGYYLARRELDLGNQVAIVDNFSRGKRDAAIMALLEHPKASLIEGNLCEQNFVCTLPLDVDYVFHLAAMNGTQNFYERPFTVLENCTLPTIYLLSHYRKDKNLKRFLFAGSSEVYASTVKLFNWEVPTDETAPLCIEDPANIRWSYGASKLHGEVACFAAASQFKIPISIIRFHNVYGPRMGDKHVIPDFISRAEKGVYELNGYEDIRAFIFVEDAVEACRLVAESPNTVNEIIHIGNERGITMLELGKLILRLMGKSDAKIVCNPSPMGSVPRRTPNVRKLREKTSFKAKVDLEEGIEKVLDARNDLRYAHG